jgi:uncharacterized protein (DUF2235 family)
MSGVFHFLDDYLPMSSDWQLYVHILVLFSMLMIVGIIYMLCTNPKDDNKSIEEKVKQMMVLKKEA